MDILIIKLGAIGDVLRTTSILEGLKGKYKGEIYWVTKRNAVDILKNNKFIDKIIVFGDKIKEEFDLVISLEDNEEGVKVVKELKYKDLIGVYPEDGEIKYTPSEWFDMSLISKFGKKKADELKAKNKKTYQQLISEMLDIKSGEIILNLQVKEINFADKFAKKHNISKNDLVIGLNTSAGKRWQLKKLDIKKTVELANKLNKELKRKIILFGGKQENERNKEIVKKVNFNIIDAGCDNSLLDFAALINLCNIIVTSDSLALIIAIALKKKIVCFFGPTSSAEIELYGRGRKIVPKIECVCCYKKKCDKKPNCMDLIKIEDIFNAVKELIQ